MPSFDIVSEVNTQEVRNAVDQANREVGQRFDFKGSDARFEVSDAQITLRAQEAFQLKQMADILRNKLARRKVDLGCLESHDPELSLHAARQTLIIHQGIDTDVAKRLLKMIKATKLKVQAQIQGEQIRVTGKKRDDLQQIITQAREVEYGIPLQFVNFRD